MGTAICWTRAFTAYKSHWWPYVGFKMECVINQINNNNNRQLINKGKHVSIQNYSHLLQTLSLNLSLLFALISLLTLISFKIPSSAGGLTVTDLPPTVFGSLNLNWPSNPGRDSHTCSHSAYMLVTLCWIWLILTSKCQRGGGRYTKRDGSTCRHERAERRQERK